MEIPRQLTQGIQIDVPSMPRALIGVGMHERVGEEARALGMRRVLVVTTGLRGTGIVEAIGVSLAQAQVEAVVYDGVESNPKDIQIMEAAVRFARQRCDGYVSVGGGSAHDAAKAARFVGAHDGRAINEFRLGPPDHLTPTPPQIAVNTTAGTGAGTTFVAVLTDTTSDDAPKKWVLRSRAIVPTLTIDDPLLGLGCPPDLTAFGGMGALALASEAQLSPLANPHSRALGGEAIRLIGGHLREAVANPLAQETRVALTWAQYLAGSAFMSGLLGIVHGISHAVGAFYDTHHGLTCGVVLPRVWADAATGQPRTVAGFAPLLGEDTAGLSPSRAADRAVEGLIRLVRDVGLPENLARIGAYTKSRVGTRTTRASTAPRVGDTQDAIDRIVDHVLEIGPFANSATVMTRERVRRLVTESMIGTL